MQLDNECKGCLYNSQLNKVEREQGSGEKLEQFKECVRALCDNPPADYCAPFLMRDIDGAHRRIFGAGIDYSRERALFNNLLSEIEEELFTSVISSPDPIKEAVKYAMAANYIDFARISDLNETAVSYVVETARRAEPDASALSIFKSKLENAETLLYLHDNCGEIVLDKILIRAIRRKYPQISVTSVVRGSDIINDVTERDAGQVGLHKFAKVVSNGTNVPGTYLKEVSPQVLKLLDTSDVIVSKGLGNLETLYGEGYNIFYCFTCKCAHIAQKFNLPLWSAALVYEE